MSPHRSIELHSKRLARVRGRYERKPPGGRWEPTDTFAVRSSFGWMALTALRQGATLTSDRGWVYRWIAPQKS
jgi:hypothetical protein